MRAPRLTVQRLFLEFAGGDSAVEVLTRGLVAFLVRVSLLALGRVLVALTSSRRPIRTGGSGECWKWRKIKTAASHEADRERWRLFERASL